MNAIPPPPPNFPPEQLSLHRSSRYQRPRHALPLWGIFIGFLLGLLGGLFYSWQIDPRRETDTLPYQLRDSDKASYAVAIALRFAFDSDLTRAVQSLVDLNLGADPFQRMADIACELASTGYVDSTAGIRAVRALQTFYQLQGKAGCADVLIVEAISTPIIEVTVPTATATLPPPPSKTPDLALSTLTPSGVVFVPTTRPTQSYVGEVINTFCDVDLSGLIEVFVQDVDGEGMPGQTVRVRWDGGEDRFVTGLKPERGTAYADFQMEVGKGYTIDMPSQADPIAQPLVADACFTDGGQEAITSYRVVFRRVG